MQAVVDQVMGPLIALCDSFAWIGEATHIIKLEALDDLLAPVATALGTGSDVGLIKGALSFFVIYPMAFIFPLINNTR
jgi:hypothetical protein